MDENEREAEVTEGLPHPVARPKPGRKKKKRKNKKERERERVKYI